MFKLSQAQSGPLAVSSTRDWVVKLTFSDRPAPDNRPLHFIKLIDVSGSMAGVLDRVKRDVESLIRSVHSSSYISLVIYSGHGQAKLLAGPTVCDAAGRKLLITALSTIHTLSNTVFSEALETVVEMVKRFGTSVRHKAVLLTDGCPVPGRWSHDAEVERARRESSRLMMIGTQLSVIGYSNYYDADFVQQLVESNGNSGMVRHINDISSFRGVIDEITGVSNKMTSAEFDLRLEIEPHVPKKKGPAGVALRTTPQVARVGTADHLYFRDVVNREVTVIVVVPEGTTEFTLAGHINRNPFLEQVQCMSLTPESAIQAAFAVGAWAFQQQRVDFAAEVLEAAGQHTLASRIANAYTTRERLELGDELRRIVTDEGIVQKYSKKTFIGKGEATCVANVLRSLVEDPGCTVFIPEGLYERTTVAVKEANIRRKPGSRMKVTRLVSNQTRYNLSIGTLVDMEQKKPGTEIWEPSTRHRNFVVVKDGSLHLDRLEAFLTPKTYDKMVNWGILDGSKPFAEDFVYTIQLASPTLPMIINSWANPKQLGLVDLLAEEQTLRVQQTAINSRIKELRAGASAGIGDFFKRTKVEEGLDSYEAPAYEYTLRGFTPSPASYASIAKLEQAEEKGREIRKRLSEVRFVSRLILMAMDFTRNKLFADVPKTPVKGSTTGKEEQIVSVASITDNPTYARCTLRRVTWTEHVPFTVNEDQEQEEQVAA